MKGWEYNLTVKSILWKSDFKFLRKWSSFAADEIFTVAQMMKKATPGAQRQQDLQQQNSGKAGVGRGEGSMAKEVEGGGAEEA